MGAAKDTPLTLAATRIVYAPGHGIEERVIDGNMVARLLEISKDQPEHLFNPETIARQVGSVADLLGRIADEPRGEDSDALYLVEQTLNSIAHRLDAMRGSASGLGEHYRIEPAP